MTASTGATGLSCLRPCIRWCLLLAALAAAACSGMSRQPWEAVPLPPEGVDQTRVATGPALHVDRVRFRSAALGDDRFFLALVPNGPQPPSGIAIVLHGWIDRPEDLLTHLSLDRVYAGLIGSGAVRPTVVVLPDLRMGSVFSPRRRHPVSEFVRYVADDVAGLAARRYGIAPDRERSSVSGFSFGGFLALDVARLRPAQFGSVVVVSGFFDRSWSFWPVRPGAAATGPVPDFAPRVLLACGTSDRFIDDMTALHRKFAAEGVTHEWLAAPGGHTWEYWSSVVKPMLVFQTGGPAPDIAASR